MKKGKTKYSSVSLPIPLLKRIQRLIKGTGFSSVASYVEFVLRERLANLSDRKIKEGVKAKLKVLGYLE